MHEPTVSLAQRAAILSWLRIAKDSRLTATPKQHEANRRFRGLMQSVRRANPHR